MNPNTRVPEGVTSPTELGRLLGVSRQRAHQIMNRKAHNARNLLSYALREGKIVKPDACARCDKETSDLEAHHHDYEKALDVRWLCPPCHSVEHPHHPDVRKTDDDPKLLCLRCGHTWWPRSTEEPTNCASCNSPYWNQPTENGFAKRCQCAQCKKKKAA